MLQYIDTTNTANMMNTQHLDANPNKEKRCQQCKQNGTIDILACEPLFSWYLQKKKSNERSGPKKKKTQKGLKNQN